MSISFEEGYTLLSALRVKGLRAEGPVEALAVAVEQEDVLSRMLDEDVSRLQPSLLEVPQPRPPTEDLYDSLNDPVLPESPPTPPSPEKEEAPKSPSDTAEEASMVCLGLGIDPAMLHHGCISSFHSFSRFFFVCCDYSIW